MQLTRDQRSTLWGWATGLGIVTIIAVGGVFLIRADDAGYDRATQRCEDAGGVYVDFGESELCVKPDFIVPTEAPDASRR